MQIPENDVTPAKARSIPFKRLIFTMVCAAFAVWFISYRMDYHNWYAPIFSAEEMQIPRRIGDYKVLGVMTSDTTACIPPGTIRIILQQAKPSDGEASVPLTRGMFADRGHIYWEFVGEGITLEGIVANLDNWNRIFFNNECLKLGPLVDEAKGENE